MAIPVPSSKISEALCTLTIEIIKKREGAGKKNCYIQQRIMIEMSNVSPTDAEIFVPFSEQCLIFSPSQYRLFSFYPSLH